MENCEVCLINEGDELVEVQQRSKPVEILMCQDCKERRIEQTERIRSINFN